MRLVDKDGDTLDVLNGPTNKDLISLQVTQNDVSTCMYLTRNNARVLRKTLKGFSKGDKFNG